MPVILVTGSPGHGKSQYAIDRCLERAQAENRRVFYSNIKGLNIPGWEQFDPKKVKADENNVHRYDGVPDGSLLVIDEASFMFGQRRGTESAPIHEQVLTTHRHAGYDIYIVTQHPNDVPAYVRRRCEEHVHLVRKKGNNFAVTYTWTDGKEGDIQGDRIGNAHHAITGIYRYRPEIWGYYQSATIHTVHRRRWPVRVYVIPFILLLAVVVAWWAYDLFSGGLGQQTLGVGSASAPGVEVKPYDFQESVEPVEVQTERRRAARGLDFVEARIQTVPGVPESEPRFIEALEVKSYPRMQCVLYGHKPLPELKVGAEVDRSPVGGVCRCYSQQATRLEVNDDLCRQVVRQGYFQPGLADKALEDTEASGEPAARSAAAAASLGVDDSMRRQREATVTVIADNSSRPSIDRKALAARLESLREIQEAIPLGE